LLTQWIEGDVPLKDHVVFCPWCVFGRHIKGDRFIRECQQRKIIEAPHLEHEIPQTVVLNWYKTRNFNSTIQAIYVKYIKALRKTRV
jgi:hypothetical protein